MDPSSLTQEKSLRGDIMCRGFYARGIHLILDARITDADNQTNKVQLVDMVLRKHECRTKQLYLRKCLDQQRHFALYIVTADGTLGKEARTFHKALSHCLAKQWKCLVSKATQFVITSMSVAILRASHRCLRGSLLPAHTMGKRISLWEDEAGLGLFFA